MPGEHIQEIAAYLRRSLPGCEVLERAGGAMDDTVLTVSAGSGEYSIRVEADFAQSMPPEQVNGALDRWRLASELCRAEGMPLVLTSAGIRLASSN